jgi:hypothetical protein
MKKTFGIDDLNGKLMIQQETNVVSYIIEGFEEPIQKWMLRKIKEQLGGNFTLITNAGVEIHTTEMKNGEWNGIKILRYKE